MSGKKPVVVTLTAGKPVPSELTQLALSWKLPQGHSINPGPMGAILEDTLLAIRDAEKRRHRELKKKH